VGPFATVVGEMRKVLRHGQLIHQRARPQLAWYRVRERRVVAPEDLTRSTMRWPARRRDVARQLLGTPTIL